MKMEPGRKVRFYAFDQLRAIMMMLGLVVHVGATYVVRDIHDVHPIKDIISTSLIFDVITGFVHTFRMPLFFVVSGFFTSMLFFERGPANMLVNRLKRIVFPFILGMIILIPLYLLAVNYFKTNAGEEVVPVLKTFKLKINAAWGNIETVHLWFLYYLSMYCLVGWAIAMVANNLPEVNKIVKIWFVEIFHLKFAPLVFAIVTFIGLATGNSIFIEGGFNLFIDLHCFVNHGYFFFFGWLLYQHRSQLERFLKYDKIYVGAGFVLFFTELFLIIIYPEFEKSSGIYLYYTFNALIPWFFTFGFIGLSLRYLNRYSRRGLYISDASYWVYLVHLPLIVLLQALLVQYHWNGMIKFTLVCTGTLSIALISYNYLVRDTFIGGFLAGKSMKPGLASPEIKHQQLNKLI